MDNIIIMFNVFKSYVFQYFIHEPIMFWKNGSLSQGVCATIFVVLYSNRDNFTKTYATNHHDLLTFWCNLNKKIIDGPLLASNRIKMLVLKFFSFIISLLKKIILGQ